MNKRQNSQLDMLQAVENHFNINAIIWNSNPVIADAKTTLSSKINQVMDMAGKQKENSTGVTIDKALLRKEFENKAFFISAAIRAYISLNPGHQELYQTVFVTKTGLSAMRESDLLYYVERLQEAAESILENLAPYGVTEATIAGLMGARTAFFDTMRMPKEIVTRRKEATEAASVLLHQAIALLDVTMDNLMEALREAQAHFVRVYFTVRKIHNISKRSMSLEITTVNAVDKTPLSDAKIEVVGKKIKRISSENGLNKVQNLKEGYYTLLVTHPDFVSQKIPFTIISGETTKVVVEMEEEDSKAQSSKGSDGL